MVVTILCISIYISNMSKIEYDYAAGKPRFFTRGGKNRSGEKSTNYV